MGHKVSPLAFRIGFIKSWKVNGFYGRRDYARLVARDSQILSTLRRELKGLPIGQITTSRTDGLVRVVVYTSKIAFVAGKENENVNRLTDILITKFNEKFEIEVREVKKPDASATLVADGIARQIEKKLPYRRAMKQAIERAMEAGALGIKVIVSGRLNGAEIARREVHKQGTIPTQTLRADIDYAIDRAMTPSGIVGIKVWVYKGEIFKK